MIHRRADSLFTTPRVLCALATLALCACPQPPGPGASPTPSPSKGATQTTSKTEAPQASPSGPAPATRTRLYPESIKPPPGQSWPVPIEPLPAALTGVPERDMPYLEVVFTVALEMIDARLRLVHALQRNAQGKPLMHGGKRVRIGVKYERFREHSAALVERLGQLDVPEGLKAFHRALVEGVVQQRTLFAKARELSLPTSRLPELSSGKRSKYQLGRAWVLLKKAYPELAGASLRSCESHLKALQPF